MRSGSPDRLLDKFCADPTVFAARALRRGSAAAAAMLKRARTAKTSLQLLERAWAVIGGDPLEENGPRPKDAGFAPASDAQAPLHEASLVIVAMEILLGDLAEVRAD